MGGWFLFWRLLHFTFSRVFVSHARYLAIVRSPWLGARNSKLHEQRLGARDEEIAENQGIHVRAPETIDRFLGAADDGFVVVEGSIEHHGHAGEITESGNERVIARIGLARDGLQSAGAVHVRRWRDLVAFLRAHGKIGRASCRERVHVSIERIELSTEMEE